MIDWTRLADQGEQGLADKWCIDTDANISLYLWPDFLLPEDSTLPADVLHAINAEGRRASRRTFENVSKGCQPFTRSFQRSGSQHKAVVALLKQSHAEYKSAIRGIKRPCCCLQTQKERWDGNESRMSHMGCLSPC